MISRKGPKKVKLTLKIEEKIMIPVKESVCKHINTSSKNDRNVCNDNKNII